MNKNTLVNLFSGSSGNCTLVSIGENLLLFDAGGTAKAIESALLQLGCDLSMIKAIFVTHEHSDHTQALSVISKKYNLPIHMTKNSAKALRIPEKSPLLNNLVLHDGEFSVTFDDNCKVEAFFTPHDSAECVGYRITSNEISIGIATDLGYVTQHVYEMLYGCEYVMIESNHDREMVKNGKYTQALKKRILSNGGHLSNDDCAEVIAALARGGTHKFMLAHLSKENNSPTAALDTVIRNINPKNISVSVACPDKITAIV